MNGGGRYGFVTSVYPNSRGVAFVVFDGPQSVIDWGLHGPRSGHSQSLYLAGISALLERYGPTVLVVQNMSPHGTRRTERIRTLNAAIATLAESRNITIRSYSRVEVRKAFAPHGLVTKEGIAITVARHIPAFERYVPPPRKPWMSEHARMGLFDAAALALAFTWQVAEE
jgi:hypothetical protein